MPDNSRIIFSDNGFQELKDYLETNGLSNRKFILLVDENTSRHCLPFILDHMPQFKKGEVLELEANESAKNLEVVGNIYKELIAMEADRSTVFINLGGGVVSDIGGFVASTFKRGMPFINIPTTLLAQVDAAIGGKTGVNLEHYKNMIGTFSSPECVFIHSDFLNTLGKDQVISGFAEILKHALISDAELWESISQMKELSLVKIKSIIERAARIKQDLVQLDPFERGERKKLNFGHTIGHALETFAMETSGRDLLHGEAVALGMMCESHISNSNNSLRKGEFEEICRVISRHFKPYDLDKMFYHRIIEIMTHDKKKSGKKMNMTLLSGIGTAVIDQSPRTDLIIDSLNFLNKYPFPK